MTHLMCRLVLKNNKLEFEGAMNSTITLDEQILEDRKYGMMKPANGKYFTYKVMDWNGKLINSKQIVRGVTYVWEEIERKIMINIKKATPSEYADFKVYFRSTADDPELTPSTLMYHYFPINDIHSQFRGLCVVNTDFPFSIDGEPVDMHFIDPLHYPKLESGVFGGTYDFDSTFEHEAYHGLGLPHSKNTKKKMSPSYDKIIEFCDDESPAETVPRAGAKYGLRNMLSSTSKRWEQWKRRRFDKY